MDLMTNTVSAPHLLTYQGPLAHYIQDLEVEIFCYPAITNDFSARWLAIKLLEQDLFVLNRLAAYQDAPLLLEYAETIGATLRQVYGEELDILIADCRYTWIHNLVSEVMHHPAGKRSLSDILDRIVTHRWLGIPIFFAIMWVIFKVTIDLSAPLLDLFDDFITGILSPGTSFLLKGIGLNGTWIEGLLVDGVLAGVGGLLAFVPVLIALYLLLAMLEDSGYMARAAFVMDGLMMKLGLQGKSFLPMLVGFGCTVPAIYATRTLENDKDRLLTALLVPFMSCGARLPVYVLFAAIFFPKQAGFAVFCVYLFGVLIAIVLGFLLRRSLFMDKEQIPLLIELPAYSLPDPKNVWRQTRDRTLAFIKNAWSMILIASVILWLLMSIPVGPTSGTFGDINVDESLFATISGIISPALKPLGFDTWEASSALITGFIAKELVVTTIAQSYQWSDPTPGQLAGNLHSSVFAGFATSSQGHAPLAGLAFMIFVLLYTPCIAAVSAMRHEFGSRWMWRAILGQLALAWLVALIIFQGGLLLGLG